MDRLSLDEEHCNRQEEWRRQLPENLGEGLRQGLSRLGISLLGKTPSFGPHYVQHLGKWDLEISAGWSYVYLVFPFANFSKTFFDFGFQFQILIVRAKKSRA